MSVTVLGLHLLYTGGKKMSLGIRQVQLAKVIQKQQVLTEV